MEDDIKKIKEIYDYLLKNNVYFGSLSLKQLTHVINSYNISEYIYKLNIIGYNNKIGTFKENLDTSIFSIKEVPLPTNNIEAWLYSYVVEYLKPYLPIKFEIYSDKYDEGGGYKMRPKIAPIYFSMLHGAQLSVYYLTQNPYF